MGLQPADGNENHFLAVAWLRRGTVKVVLALDESRPSLSLAWNVCFEVMSVTLLNPPSGKGSSA